MAGDDIVLQPTHPADDGETCIATGKVECGTQFVQHVAVVLLRLDGSDHQEVSPPARAGGSFASRRDERVDATIGNLDGRSSARSPENTPKVSGGSGGDGEKAIGSRRERREMIAELFAPDRLIDSADGSAAAGRARAAPIERRALWGRGVQRAAGHAKSRAKTGRRRTGSAPSGQP